LVDPSGVTYRRKKRRVSLPTHVSSPTVIPLLQRAIRHEPSTGCARWVHAHTPANEVRLLAFPPRSKWRRGHDTPATRRSLSLPTVSPGTQLIPRQGLWVSDGGRRGRAATWSSFYHQTPQQPHRGLPTGFTRTIEVITVKKMAQLTYGSQSTTRGEGMRRLTGGATVSAPNT
jgi:hypothetical protein